MDNSEKSDAVRGPFRLSGSEVRPDLNRIVTDSVSNRVEPKVMAVLLRLVDEAGQVVSKEELLRSIWGVATEDVLSRAVSQLRKALGDDPKNPEVIETIWKVGYRIVCDVVPLAEVGTGVSHGAPSRSRPLAIGLGAAIVAAGGLWALSRLGSAAPAAPVGAPTLAVLPFDYVGQSSESYLADGVSDAIRARLAGVQGLSVISRSSANQFQGSLLSAGQLGDSLGADYLLEGTLQGGVAEDATIRLRVTPNLIRTSDDSHLWTRTYDQESLDVFQIQSDISERVAEALDLTLQSEESALVARPTENQAAYDAYLQGLDVLRRMVSPADAESFQAAIQHYERALDLDPQFSLAAAALSQAHLRLFATADPSQERLLRAKASADLALEVAPELPEAHEALGYYHYLGSLDRERALLEFSYVLERQPSNALAHSVFAGLQAAGGNWREAQQSVERSSRLDPRAAGRAIEAGTINYFMREWDRAERLFRSAAALAPSDPRVPAMQAAIHIARSGSLDAAEEALFSAVGRIPAGLLVESVFSVHALSLLRSERFQDLFREAPLDMWPSGDTLGYYQAAARVWEARGVPVRAHAYWDSTSSVGAARLVSRPNSISTRALLVVALAATGSTADAGEHVDRLQGLVAQADDHFQGAVYVAEVAEALARVGDHDAAIDLLEQALAVPSIISTAGLELDPRWDPLRGHARFRQLLGLGDRR